VTVVTDLSRADDVPGEQFDCFVLQFTLHLIADVEAALYHAIRLLKPGGVLLANFSCVDYQFPNGLDMGTGATLWVHWCFTPLQVHNLLRRLGLSPADYELEVYGNLFTRVAYQLCVPAEELTLHELQYRDPGHPLLLCVRATRPAGWSVEKPPYREAWVPDAAPHRYDSKTGLYPASVFINPREPRSASSFPDSPFVMLRSYPIRDLQSNTGNFERDRIVCIPRVHKEGHCLFGGDYLIRQRGHYRATYEMMIANHSAAQDPLVVLEIYENRRTKTVLAERKLDAVDVAGERRLYSIDFFATPGHCVEFRAYWAGQCALTITGVILREVRRSAARQ